MRGFRERREVAAVLAILRAGAAPLAAEEVAVADASDRILAADVVAPIDVPGFRRAAVDGYAVRGEDTFAASELAPIALRLCGQSMPGRPSGLTLGPGEAIRITTGAPLPAGADAVLQAELARAADGVVLAIGAVAPLRHIGEVGEDIARGQVILRAGRRLRPQDAGVIASLGLGRAPVIRRPRVLALSTGDELVAAGEPLGPHQIVDSNSVTLAGLCARDRAEFLPPLRSRDGRDNLVAALDRAEASDADVIVACGATSVGSEDWLPLLLGERGELLVHGVAMRPASPTGVGRLGDGRWVFLLPGNPVSCLCAYEFFVGPLLRALGGRSDPWRWPHPRLRLPLARKLTSKIGRTDFVRVALTDDGRAIAPVATSGASLLSTAVIADGVVIVDPESEGWAVGEEVEMLAFDDPRPAEGGAIGHDP
ncbi:MAG: molybdopterin molybdotransferase MoeA [Myxococcales bacterium]|nr:molybdopterin molybdotransferase MoeA [Myxococcales bacterium]MCB9705346.1 molybdopterin molybdotransferase MoeA [Myxococcales bacterium]